MQKTNGMNRLELSKKLFQNKILAKIYTANSYYFSKYSENYTINILHKKKLNIHVLPYIQLVTNLIIRVIPTKTILLITTLPISTRIMVFFSIPSLIRHFFFLNKRINV